MADKDINQLIESFKAYRDLLTPIQLGLEDFIGTYDAMRGNVDKLSDAFTGDSREKMDKGFKDLSEKVSELNNLMQNELARNFKEHREKLDVLNNRFNEMLTLQQKERDDLEKLLTHYSETGELLKKIAEKGDVNEVYIFEIIDRWAETRKVKTKK